MPDANAVAAEELDTEELSTAGLSTAELSTTELNTEVIRRYLRVFETRNVAELEDLVDEDVLVHRAGHHVQGRRYPEGSIVTPGLSDCRVRVGRIVEFWGETDLYGLLRRAGLVPEQIPAF